MNKSLAKVLSYHFGVTPGKAAMLARDIQDRDITTADELKDFFTSDIAISLFGHTGQLRPSEWDYILGNVLAHIESKEMSTFRDMVEARPLGDEIQVGDVIRQDVRLSMTM